MADDDAPVPSLTSGEIGSRFVSQTELDAANKKRDEAWNAAYARLGQEPPPREEAVYDGRSLAEKLAANKAAKQEEWEQKNKLSNQFRALESDEVLFLDSVSAAEHKKEQERKAADDEAIDGFKATLTHDECISFGFTFSLCPRPLVFLGSSKRLDIVRSQRKQHLHPNLQFLV